MFTDLTFFPAAPSRNAHPITTIDQENAYYRQHTLNVPLWLTATVALVRRLHHGLAAAIAPMFHRHSHG